MNREPEAGDNPGTDIAVIGMAGRWPGASGPDQLWRNVRAGVESISRLSAEELDVAGAAELAKRPDYVKARSILDGADLFDAGFFGILPKDAELLDPQHRVFLECCWQALEDAGYDPQAYAGAIGVVAGCGLPTYFLRNVCADRRFIEEFTDSYPLGGYSTMLGVLSDTLATRVSYKLNLRGPSFTLQTACSTSLVAVSQACQSLLSYQCDMMLAGGVAITFPQKRGYLYQEGGMGSADGYCRPFEARAKGTVFGSGAGVVLLKRLDDARADGDHVHAVIKGFAVNNDGATKVGFTAPSVDGQAQVIAQAQALAGVSPESIGYLEGHGTATPLGDPIEFTALNRAFREGTAAKQFCALGTIKRNLGHLEMAAGVTGLINAVQALSHRELPPAAGFEAPNPNIDLANSPFYINTRAAEWPAGPTPRRAGVSSFGVGGTNAHVILEEAPAVPAPAERPAHLLVLSARSAAALDRATDNLANHLKSNPDIDLSSVAYTLQAGRRAFEHRRAVVCTDTADAVRALESRDRNRVQTRQTRAAVPVVFMFPGQGSQYRGMGTGLYQFDAGFRADIDRCAEILRPHLRVDLRGVLTGAGDAPDLRQTYLAQPALFVLGYATARLWQRWGVTPQAMVGHSVGEFVAACLAGVFSLEDALAIVATRGRMAQEQPAGTMLAVRLTEDEVAPWLSAEVSLAAANSPQLSVLAGPEEAIAPLEQKLIASGVAAIRLSTSHAFHSAMMDPVIGPFTEYLRRFRLNPPQVPFVSGVTGDWIRPDEATDPEYWARHLRQPVLFSKCIRLLRSDPARIFLEVGPNSVLCKLARQHRGADGAPTAVASLPDAPGARADALAVLTAAGALWLHGAPLNPNAMHGPRARRCPLPTYPFERQRYWIDPPAPAVSVTTSASADVPPADQPPTVAPPRPEAAMPAAPPRTDRLRSAVIGILQDLSGTDLAGCDPGATFLELGFDSLFLTQVTQELQNTFGVKVTFRQLLDRESSPEALAAYLDAQMPPDAAPAEPPPAAPVAVPVVAPVAGPVFAAPSPHGAGAPTNALEAVIREQLQLMARQLDTLRGAPTTAMPQAVPAVPPAAPQPAAPQPAAAAPQATKPTDPQEFKAHGRFKPIQRGPLGGLTEQQSAHLDALVRRVNARTPGSKKVAADRRAVMADPRAASGFRSQWKEMVYPVVTIRSRGSKLWDVDGNEYIDLVNGFGPIFFGHAPDFVTEAVAAQLKEGFETGPSTPLAGECAALVNELTGNERTTFCNTGSEAVMAAMRLARTVTGRRKIVMFTGDYHGTFDEVLVKGIQKAGAPHSLPLAPGICPEAVANVIVLDYGTPESLEYIRKNARDLAAVIVEPVQSRHPALQPVEFLREIRKITEESETALIFDEVVTGFRTHPGGIQALFGIRADLATYGKVAGGGLPVGILSGKAKFMDALDGGAWRYGDDSFPEVGVTFFAGTFVRHPLAMAATRAVLQKLKECGPGLQKGLAERVADLARRVNAVFAEYGVPAKAEQFSSWFYFGFTSDHPYASLLYYHLREKGVFILEGFPCFLTTAHTDADFDAVVKAFRDSAAEMQAAGFLSEPTASAPPAAPAVPAPAELPREAPLTEPQFEVLLSARLGDEQSCSFNEAFALHLRGALDPAVLGDCLTQLVARHDALRTTFDPSGERFRVAEPAPLELPIADLSALPTVERTKELEDLIRADAATPFDLVAGPLVRVQLVKLEPDHHALLFTSHHIVFDGWSANIVLGELAALYAARAAGTAPALPAAPAFRQYALDQDRWKRSAERAELEAWWVKKFETPVTPLDLPTDRPRPAVKSFNGDTVRRTIDAPAYQRIKKFGAKQGCTLFATLLAGFKTLAHRLSGQPDIVVGIPAAGQSLLSDGSLVGHCVNFLPLRTSFEGDPTAAALLKQVRATLLDAYDHQNYTFGSLVQKLGVRRDPSRLPIVEIQFNLEKIGAGLEFPGLKAEVDPCPKQFVNFDLFLNVVESDTGLVLDLDYNTNLFDRATAERWLGHFETLLESMAADPALPISAVPMLSAAEQQRVLVEWNQTRFEYPRGASLARLIEEQVARTPNAVAVVFGDQSVTYAELNGRANRLARELRARGAGPESLVAVYLERSIDLMTALLAVVKAGAGYLPLDTLLPPQRVRQILEDSGAKAVLTQKELRGSLPDGSAAVVAVDDSGWHSHGCDNLDVAVDPQHLGYVIYTSGSTGKPKGVAVSRGALNNLLWSVREWLQFGAGDRLLAVTTISFDIAGADVWLPLLVGASTVIASREQAGEGEELKKLLDRHDITFLQATPVTWRMLLGAGWAGKRNLQIVCTGEAMPAELAAALPPLVRRVWNLYGPTETTIWSTGCVVKGDEKKVLIGRPIGNTRCYILNNNLRPVPPGAVGELYIAGDGVARGYINRPDLTAEKFLPDPFGSDPGDRMFRTGDLARYHPDGAIECLGRKDHQVKIRGYRIELGEIESVLASHPGVGQAVVVERDARLVGYIVPVAGRSTPAGDLRHHLRQWLPEYMIPQQYVELDTLPLTPSGKVDRRALPAPPAEAVTGSGKTPPRTPQEQALAQICAGVLQQATVYADDNLFDLGLDSLRLFQIVARGKDRGLNLTAKHIFTGQTVAAICAELAQAEGRTANEPTLAAVRRDNYRFRRPKAEVPDGSNN